MKDLTRLKVGRFSIEDAITITQLVENKDREEFLKKHIILPQDLFIDKPSIKLDTRKMTLFLNGVKLKYNYENGLYNILDENSNWIGIGIIKEGYLKRDFVI